MPKVLIVETQIVLCRSLAIRLHRLGCLPLYAPPGGGRLARALSPPPDAVVFGASVGLRQALTAGRGVRRMLEGPIIVEVPPGENRRWVRDLKYRSDVYFIDAGQPALLAEKLGALLIQTPRGKPFVFGGLTLSPGEHRLLRDGEPIPLTPLEHELLLRLMRGAGESVESAALIREVWDSDSEALIHTLRSHITGLRGKLGPYRGCIRAVRGLGYRFLWEGGNPPAQQNYETGDQINEICIR